jgi:hypothetical protein
MMGLSHRSPTELVVEMAIAGETVLSATDLE